MAKTRFAPVAALLLLAVSLAGCGSFNSGGFGSSAGLGDRECMARVMYFESNRSSDDGMMAVGTVVMNRVQNPRYPKTICGVVGQDRQFADGALSKPVNRRSLAWAKAERAANAVISGERHAGVGGAMFFHTHGYRYPYRNMHYVTLAGGNVFYEKRTPGTFTPVNPNTMLAYTPKDRPLQSRPTLLASAETERAAEPVRYSRPAREPVRLAENARDIEPVRYARPSRTPVRPSEDARDMGPVRASRPVALASAETARESEPVRAPRQRPMVMAARDDEPPRRAEPARPAAAGPVRVVERKWLDEPAPAKARPVVAMPTERPRPALAVAEPPARPKPIVLAMADTKPRPARRPNSIEEIIAMDLHQR